MSWSCNVKFNLCVMSLSLYSSLKLKVPMTPKVVFCPVELLCHAKQNGEKKIFFWVKTGIFHEFSNWRKIEV